MLSSDRADFTAREVVRHREEYLLLLFSCQVMSCRPHGLQHARLLCPLLSPGVCSDSCPLNHWCHPLILCCPLLLLSVFPSIRVFFSESALCNRWPKHWSFSISPPSEYSGLISFRIEWFDLFAVCSQESSPTTPFKSIHKMYGTESVQVHLRSKPLPGAAP